MVRTKTKKLRGGHYGRGMKSGRGKGKRGGSGMAGLGGHRKIWLILHDKEHFGVHGFTSHFKYDFHDISDCKTNPLGRWL